MMISLIENRSSGKVLTEPSIIVKEAFDGPDGFLGSVYDVFHRIIEIL
jgi:hypothetical protein